MRPFGRRKLSGPLVLQSAVASLATTPGDCRAGGEHNTSGVWCAAGFGWLVGWFSEVWHGSDTMATR